jgi:hypothetical protein
MTHPTAMKVMREVHSRPRHPQHKIRGLWQRGTKYYAQLRVTASRREFRYRLQISRTHSQNSKGAARRTAKASSRRQDTARNSRCSRQITSRARSIRRQAEHSRQRAGCSRILEAPPGQCPYRQDYGCHGEELPREAARPRSDRQDREQGKRSDSQVGLMLVRMRLSEQPSAN